MQVYYIEMKIPYLFYVLSHPVIVKSCIIDYDGNLVNYEDNVNVIKNYTLINLLMIF